MLGLWYSFLANHIVQTDALRILPEVEKDEQVNEEGSTLTLTCIDDADVNAYFISSNDPIWKLPRSEVT
jgi:hypothetical protein